MSWKVVADKSGKWVEDASRFATYEEAEAYALTLMDVRETRVVGDYIPPRRGYSGD